LSTSVTVVSKKTKVDPAGPRARVGELGQPGRRSRGASEVGNSRFK